MKKVFIQKDKVSKKIRKNMDSEKRVSWGQVRPHTRIIADKRTYDRKRFKNIDAEE